MGLVAFQADSTKVSFMDHPGIGLTEGWRHGYDSEGRVYYYNEEGAGSTWDRPIGSSPFSPTAVTVVDGTQWDSDWDMRKKNKNHVVHQIVMVRHGQYERDGKSDAEHKLTAIGRQQAEATGKRLSTLLSSGLLSPFKTVYFSTMTRATETCQLILPQLPQLPPTSKTMAVETTAKTGKTGIAVPTLASTSSAIGTGSTAVGSGMRVEACSMIREGAVCRPSPPCTGWDPSDEDFEKEGARVSHLCKPSYYFCNAQ